VNKEDPQRRNRKRTGRKPGHDPRPSLEPALDTSRAKSRFLAMVSHEMRTPLNAILGLLDLTLRGEPEGQRREYLRTARVAGDQLLQLINDLLDLAKIESGTLALRARPFSLRGLLEGCTASLAPRARQKGVDLTFQMAEGMADGVRGDAARVRQVLLNLLDNAVKFTDEGRVTVSVRPAQGSNRLSFSVTDTGVGVAPADRERIFEPFMQADSSDTRRHGGTGLGLAICRQLVERMRGHIWLESAPVRGSTFHFDIELEPDPSGDALPAKDLAALKGTRVIVLHRNADLQERLCGMLREAGLDPTLVEDPFLVPAMLREAQERGRAFRVILLDPHVRGAAALQARRPEDDSLVAQLPRIILSDDPSRAAGVLATSPAVPGCTADGDLLRAIHEALAESRKTASEPKPAARPELPKRPLRVLVAEDNSVNALVVVRMLEMLGHGSAVAEDGAGAIALLESESYDVVLMDLQMPGMDGIEAMVRIRARERERGVPRTRLVAVTASAVRKDVKRSLAAGADAFLTKPFPLEALRDALLGIEAGAVGAPAEGVLDLARLEAQLGNDADGVEEVLATFQAQAPDSLARIQESIAAGDARALERAAHKLRGALAWIGAEAAAQAASRLERLAAAGELVGAADALAELEKALRAVSESIEHRRSLGRPPAP
jgi:two-component system, sensor histidine kinase and response regulator